MRIALIKSPFQHFNVLVVMEKNSVIITNSRKRADYNVQRLVCLGFPIDIFEKVVSSGGGA